MEDTDEDASLALDHPPTDSFDAIIKGVADGVAPLIGVVSVLLTTIALVTLANMTLAQLPSVGGQTVSLQWIFAWPFRPVTWLIGVPWHETAVASSLMATKTVMNEFVAYRDDERPGGRRAFPEDAPDHDLCAMWLRQFRQHGHSRRRP